MSKYFYNREIGRMLEIDGYIVTVYEEVFTGKADDIKPVLELPTIADPLPPKSKLGGGSTLKKKHKKNQKVCKNCGEVGHMAKTCKFEGPVKDAEVPENREPVAAEGDEELTDDQKAEILEKFNDGMPPSVNTPTLAKEYGVSIKAIWNVIRNRPK